MNNSKPIGISKFIELPNGLHVHYRESGNGDIPLLFVPGWTMTTDVFTRQLKFFAASADYRFITLDPRSHGKTMATATGNHYEQHGRDLHEFISVLKLENLILCGWSFGTLATLSYINQYGYSKLAGLIMLDGPPKATGSNTKQDWVTYSHDDKDGSQEFFTLGKLRDPHRTNKDFACWMLEDKNKEAVNWIIDMTNHTPDESAALLNATAVFLDYSDDLIQIGDNVPVWCVVREDRHQAVFDWCRRYLRTARLSAFGEHMMFWEQSDRFNRELHSFLKSCRKSG